MFDCSTVCPKKSKADCCGYVPMENEFWEKNKNKAQVEVKVMKWDDDHVLPLTENLDCAFLDKNYKCVVYDERPKICRLFGTKEVKGFQCPYLKPSGQKRGKKERNKLVGENNGQMNKIAKRINVAFEMASQGKTFEEIKEVIKLIKAE